MLVKKKKVGVHPAPNTRNPVAKIDFSLIPFMLWNSACEKKWRQCNILDF
jgi:hypothetical protein